MDKTRQKKRFSDEYADEEGLRGAIVMFSCDSDKPRALRLLAHSALDRIYPERNLGTLDELDAWGEAAVERVFALDRAQYGRPLGEDSAAVRAYYAHTTN